MQKLFTFFIVLMIIGFTMCKEKTKSVLGKTASDSTAFFPILNFIKEDIKEVEENPYYIYKIEEQIPGKRDSSVISIEEFKTIASNFLKTEVGTEQMKARFKESVFHDLTTKSIILTYSTNDSLSELQNVNVLLDDTNNKWKRIFMRSSFNKGDTAIIEQYNWKARKSFQLIQSKTIASGKEFEKKITIIWNDKPYDQ